MQGLSIENTRIIIDSIALVGWSASNPKLNSISKQHWTSINCKKSLFFLIWFRGFGGVVNSITKNAKWEGYKNDIDYFVRAAAADC